MVSETEKPEDIYIGSITVYFPRFAGNIQHTQIVCCQVAQHHFSYSWAMNVLYCCLNLVFA